ncbi:MAG: hypothetical protein ABFD46_02435 [Armatimonadota bacterium]
MTDNEIRDKMKNLPDLPGLETVEPRDSSMLPILLYLGIMVSLIVPGAVMTILHYGKFIDQRSKVLIIIFAALLAWVILRLLSGYYRFKTDANGLTMVGALRRRSIPWIDVKEAYLQESKTSGYNLILKTQHGTVKFEPRNWGLIASAWQHLRRLGRAEGMSLPPQALSFWEPVPDDVPHEIDWSKKSAAGDIIPASVVVLFFGGIAIYLLFMVKLLWSPMGLIVIWMTISLFIMLKWLLLPEALYKPWRIRVREDYIEANLPFAKAYIPWSEITSAHFTNNNSGGLVIKYGSRKSEIRVFYMQGKKELEDLILAIVRKLRASSGIVIALPEFYSRNPEALYKPAYSSQGSQRKVRAFLNTLDPPVKKKISNLYYSQIAAIPIGLALGFAAMFTSPLEHITRSLHRTPNTLFFFTSTDMWLFFPVLCAVMVISVVITNRIGNRMPNPYHEAWLELNKVQSVKGKFYTVMVVIGLVICAVMLLSCVPFIDSYTRITDKGITTNGFWSLGHEDFHSWNQVKRILVHETYTTKSKSLVYEVLFTDGKRWKVDEGKLGLMCSKDIDSAINHISEKSDRKMEYPQQP